MRRKGHFESVAFFRCHVAMTLYLAAKESIHCCVVKFMTCTRNVDWSVAFFQKNIFDTIFKFFLHLKIRLSPKFLHIVSTQANLCLESI